jgi:CRISPR-associated protein Csm3
MTEATIPLQLSNYYVLSGVIRCMSGLHIGAGNETIEIGGTDRPVIKHPLEGYPYIPGSSLKGKLRALLEIRHAAFAPNGGPGKSQSGPTGFVGRIFGVSAGDDKGNQLPTALLVRDAIPTSTYRAELSRRRAEGLTVFEQKSENSINRVTAEANPRTIERVPAGAGFTFEAIYRIFARHGNDDQSRADFAHVLEALALLQLDTLGGHGSRGYGRVAFENLKCVDLAGNEVPIKPLMDYLKGST